MYTDQAQMIERFGEEEMIRITDREDAGAVDADVLGRALAEAAAVVDSYLAPRYPLPLSAALVEVSALPRVCGDIARYMLYDDHASEEVERRYERAIKWLRDVSRGDAALGAGDHAATGPGHVVRRQGESRFDWEAH